MSPRKKVVPPDDEVIRQALRSAQADDPRQPSWAEIVSSSPSPQVRRRPILAMALVVVPIVGAGTVFALTRSSAPPPASGDQVPAATVQWVDTASKFTVRYPSSWKRALTPLTPGLFSPKEILSVGTGPLTRSGVEANMPDLAAQEAATGGVLVSIQEASVGPDAPLSVFPPWPSHLVLDRAKGDARPGGIGDVGNALVWWMTFRAGERGFFVLVVASSKVTSEDLHKAEGVIDSFEPTPT